MLASTAYNLTRVREDDWFDAILNADTPLFLDPFMVFKDSSPRWKGAHDKIIQHFDKAFDLIAEGNLDEKTLPYRKALDLLQFHEPRELCLGYSSAGTSGSGSGRHYALKIAEAIANAIHRGLRHPKHFEELGILNEGIGADRISDISSTILKPDLLNYTQEIAARHNIPLSNHPVFAAGFDSQRLRFQTPTVSVPTNPSIGGPFLFVPERFLRDLPVLNADDWWNDYENQQLRDDLNYEIMGNVRKSVIVAAARRNPALVRDWMRRKERKAAASYDFARDPNGVWQWDKQAASFTNKFPLRLNGARTEEEFNELIKMIIGQFRLFIEEQGGWDLLWNSGVRSEKPEHAAQLVFRGIAQHYCEANNISLDPEVNLGRGPVDFKFSTGFQFRAHVEIKKLHNGKFWGGLESQLPSYLRSDKVKNGWFIAIRYRDGRAGDERAKELPARVDKVSTEKDLNLQFLLIDGRPPPSASKIN